MSWKERARKTVGIRAAEGFMWVGFSPAANGMAWGDAAFDAFIELQVKLYEGGGWALVEYAVSVSSERVSLRFKDTRRRRFVCRVEGEIMGAIDGAKLVEVLKKGGIEAKIEGFELCNLE